jgi:hypothetical protein
MIDIIVLQWMIVQGKINVFSMPAMWALLRRNE